MLSHVCFHCNATKPTAKSLRKHIRHKQECKEAFNARLNLRIARNNLPSSLDSQPMSLFISNNENPIEMDIHEELPYQPQTINSPLNTSRRSRSDSSPSTEPPSKRSRVEDVQELEAGGLPKTPFVDYPGSDYNAGCTYGRGKNLYESMKDTRREQGICDDTSQRWAPFENQEEWELGQWLMESGLSHSDIDKYLKLNIVSDNLF
jgi:hypothetical protein